MIVSKPLLTMLKRTAVSVSLGLASVSGAALADVIPDFTDAPFTDRDSRYSRAIMLEDTFYIGMSGGRVKGLFSYTEEEGWKKMSRGGRAIDDDNGDLIIRDRNSVYRRVDNEFQKVAEFDSKPRTHWVTAAGSGLVVTPVKNRRIGSFVAKDLNTGESVAIPDFPFGGETKFLNLRITNDKLYAKVGVWRSAYHLYSLSLEDVRNGGGEWFEVQDANEEALAFPDYRGTGSEIVAIENTETISRNEWQDLSTGLPTANERGVFTLVVKDDVVYASTSKVGNGGIYALNGDTLEWEKIANHKSGYNSSYLVSAAGRLYISGNLNVSEFEPDTGRYYDITAQLTDKKLFGLKIYGSEFGLIAKGANKKDRKGKDWLAMYDAEQGVWNDIELPARGRVDKVKTDKAGNLWMNMKDNPDGGVFRAIRNIDGTYQPFEVKSVHSAPFGGSIAIANDGEIYYIREKTRHTQIQAVYRYEENDQDWQWVQVTQDKGYGAPGFAIGENALFVASGRFNEYVIQGSKKWTLPNTEAVSGAQYRSAVVNDVALMIETTETGERSSIESIKALRIDGENIVPYDANLNLYGTYLTNESAQGVATEILENGNILVAMNIESGEGQQSGKLMLLSSDGQGILDEMSISDRIYDLDTDSSGSNFAVSHGNNVSVFTPDFDGTDFESFSQLNVDTGARAKSVALADDGRFVVLANKSAKVFEDSGTVIYERDFNFSYVTDVEIDATGDNYYLTSFNNQTLPSGKPVQSARIASYNIAAGAESGANWVRFNERGSALSNDIADTRLYRVEFGADGNLYTLGESAGTKSQFRWDGTELNGESPLRFIDHHNDLWNTGSAHVAYHARIDAATGDILDAQMTMGRLNSGKSNTFRVKDGGIDKHVFGDITASADGMHVVVGSVNAHMANRAGGLSVNGEPVSVYNGGDATIMAVGQNFRSRPTWATLDKSNDFNGFVGSVAIRGNKMVVLTDVKKGETFISDEAIIKNNTAGNGVHLSIIDMESQYQKGGLNLD